jgi:5'-nucleotidase
MLGAGHEVFLCTSPLTGSRWCVPEKLAWVGQHLGPRWLRRTIITADKTWWGIGSSGAFWSTTGL